MEGRKAVKTFAEQETFCQWSPRSIDIRELYSVHIFPIFQEFDMFQYEVFDAVEKL